jgi:hypothetical protein
MIRGEIGKQRGAKTLLGPECIEKYLDDINN